MAKKEEATLLFRVAQKGGKVFKEIQNGIKRVGAVASAAVGSFKLMGAAFGAVSAVAIKAAKDFGEFQGVKRAYTSLANSQGADSKKMLASMRELSAGTISQVELMKQANNAMLLGLPINRMDDMLKIARSSAQATGQDMGKMFADLTTGLGRGSKLVLDNLGITFKLDDAYKEYAKTLGTTVNKLTEAEKKQAFINKALAVGVENTAKSGEAQLTMNESLAMVTAGLSDFSIFIGQSAAPAVQFFSETLGAFFQNANNDVNGSLLSSFFENTAKVVVVAKGQFLKFGAVLGNMIASISSSAGALFSGQFTKAVELWSLGAEREAEIVQNQAMKTAEELNRIDDLYAKSRAEQAVINEQEKFAQLKAVKQENQLELDAEKEAKLNEEILDQQRELAMIDQHELGKKAMRLAYMREDIAKFKGHAKEKQLLQAKYAVEEKKFEQAVTEFNKAEDEKRAANRASTLSTISTLQNSNNKALAAAGKAAAITQIAIETPVAIAKALSAFPPPVNFVAAGLVGVAMGAQAANIAGVKLAEGGIVPATPGGIQATIGEGGRNEAVIPLPDNFDPDSGSGLGGGVTVVFNGPLLGDESTAREFALMLDEQLLELRRNNQSLAFDSGVI